METNSTTEEYETFEYNIKVSRDIYDGYDKYVCSAKVLPFKITISRNIEFRDDFNAFLYGDILKNKTDKRNTVYEGNALWNGFGYKSKKDWDEIIDSYETIGQLERDFMI